MDSEMQEPKIPSWKARQEQPADSPGEPGACDGIFAPPPPLLFLDGCSARILSPELPVTEPPQLAPEW